MEARSPINYLVFRESSAIKVFYFASVFFHEWLLNSWLFQEILWDVAVTFKIAGHLEMLNPLIIKKKLEKLPIN